MELKQSEKELETLMQMFEGFSKIINASLLVHDHDWPNLLLEWNYEKHKRKLQIYLNPDRSAYSLAGYKIEDEKSGKEDIIKIFDAKIRFPFSTIGIRSLERYYKLINKF